MNFSPSPGGAGGGTFNDLSPGRRVSITELPVYLQTILAAIALIKARSMTISYNWLSEYLPVTIEPERLSKILTSIGLEVEKLETFEEVKGGLKGLVIGEVLQAEQHPNADKLKLTKVFKTGLDICTQNNHSTQFSSNFCIQIYPK